MGGGGGGDRLPTIVGAGLLGMHPNTCDITASSINTHCLSTSPVLCKSPPVCKCPKSLRSVNN